MAPITTSSKTFKLALIQLSVGINKTANLTRATAKIEEAAKNGAQVSFFFHHQINKFLFKSLSVNCINASILCLQVISLPECFNSPYGTKYFPEYAEPLIDGPTTNTLKAAAEKNKVCYNNCRADEMILCYVSESKA